MPPTDKRATSEAGKLTRWLDPVAPGNFRERLRPAMFLVFLGILVFLFLMPLFTAPFESDQGAYATVARGWIGGSIPYRDLWDNKGPLLFLWYVLSFALFGQNQEAPRIVAALAAGASIPFLWAAVRNLFDRHAALVAAVIFALSFSNIFLQVTANSEVFMLLPLTAGFWAFAVGVQKQRYSWLLWSGILTSLAVFTRQSAILTFFAYLAWLAMTGVQRRNDGNQQPIWAAGSLLAGGVLGACPFVIYFALHGALHDLWYATLWFNAGFMAEQSFWLKFVPPFFVEPGPLAGGLIFWILAIVGFRELWRRQDGPAWLVIFFLMMSEAAAQIVGKGSAHYCIHLLPGGAIAAVFGITCLRNHWRSGGLALRVALVAATGVTAIALLFAYGRPTAAARFKAQYMFRDYANDTVDAPAIASAVAARSAAGDCVYEWGRTSQIYFLSDRQPCTRWFYDRPYELRKSMISEVVADLQKRKPTVIMLTTEVPAPLELSRLIEEDYRFDGQVKFAKLYVPLDRTAAQGGRSSPSADGHPGTMKCHCWRSEESCSGSGAPPQRGQGEISRFARNDSAFSMRHPRS